jgi:hypothetical protein
MLSGAMLMPLATKGPATPKRFLVFYADDTFFVKIHLLFSRRNHAKQWFPQRYHGSNRTMKPSSLFATEEWSLGIVRQTVDDIARRGIQEPVLWFPRDRTRIYADPFCLKNPDDSVTIFAEVMNHWIGKGEIWAAPIKRGYNPIEARFEPVITAPVHLSYPCFIKDHGEVYGLVESHEAGELALWRRKGNRWLFEKTLLARPSIDATLYRDSRTWWLFCTFADDNADERLHLFHSDSLLGDWTPHPMNPVKQDKSSARPAGALFMVDGQLIRPAQDCSETYGGKITLNRVVTLTTEAFVEETYRVLGPNSDYYVDGIHTIADAGDFTLIDGKRWLYGPGVLACRVIAKLFKIYRRGRAGLFRSHTIFVSSDLLPTP